LAAPVIVKDYWPTIGIDRESRGGIEYYALSVSSSGMVPPGDVGPFYELLAVLAKCAARLNANEGLASPLLTDYPAVTYQNETAAAPESDGGK
jgi:hypothetical protein